MMMMTSARWCDLGASGCLCLPVCGHHRAFVVIIRIFEIIVDNIIIQHPSFACVMFLASSSFWQPSSRFLQNINCQPLKMVVVRIINMLVMLMGI